MSDFPKFEPLPNAGNVVSNNVTAFNQGYNLYQCINYLQGYVSIVYNSMDELLDDWNNFQEVVNKNITNIATEESQKILNQWIEDGTLNDLIALDPLWNQKLDKTGGTMTGNIKFSENTKIVGTTPGGNDIDLIHNTNDGASGNYVKFGDPDAKTVINSSQQPVWHNGDDHLLLTQKQLDDGLAGKVNKTGDTMTGNLNLNASMNLNGKITRGNVNNIVSMDADNTIFGDENYITLIRSKNGRVFIPDSSGINNNGVLTTGDPRDNLTSTEKHMPLSANQGRVLNDKILKINKHITSMRYVTKVFQLQTASGFIDLYTKAQLMELLGLSGTIAKFNEKIWFQVISGDWSSNNAYISAMAYDNRRDVMYARVENGTIGACRFNILIVYSEEGEISS